MDFNNSRANKIWALSLYVYAFKFQKWEVGLLISNKHRTTNYLFIILITSLLLAEIISCVFVENSTSKGSICIYDNYIMLSAWIETLNVGNWFGIS